MKAEVNFFMSLARVYLDTHDPYACLYRGSTELLWTVHTLCRYSRLEIVGFSRKRRKIRLMMGEKIQIMFKGRKLKEATEKSH